jgi:opacity protein-like surface antigen
MDLPLLGPSVLRAEYLVDGQPTTSYDLNGPVLRTALTAQYARVALISTADDWRSPPQVASADWEGNYFGVIGGGAQQDISTRGLGATTSYSANGPIGGIYSGHNWMFGDAMLGVDGATMLAHVAGSGAEPAAASTSYQNFLESDLRGRAGYAVGAFLPFVATGLDFGSSQQVDNTTGNAKANLPVLAGAVGAGLDIMASERLAIRAEYLRSRSLVNETTHLDSDACCNQSRIGNSLRLGAAYFFH